MRLPVRHDLPAPTNVLGDWTAQLVVRAPEDLVFCMSERTLLVVIVPARDALSLPKQVRSAASELLLALNIPSASVDAELAQMAAIEVGATNNRKVLGCLTEAIVEFKTMEASRRFRTLRDAELHLAENAHSTVGYLQPVVIASNLLVAVEGTGMRPT